MTGGRLVRRDFSRGRQAAAADTARLKRRTRFKPESGRTMAGNILRRFNTAGPCDPMKRHMPPVLPLLSVADMIDGEFYFVISAPHQSGKTTYPKAIRDKIDEDGEHLALWCRAL
jgi:hypothetical protein